MRTLNRRLWSIPKRRGITDLIEFATPKGILYGITRLEIFSQSETLGIRDLTAQKILSDVEQYLPEVLARNQDEAQ